MEISREINEIRRERWRKPEESWGLVPTMGALHRGHISLIQKARAENDKIGVSIFVNPIQFNNADDLLSYPKSLEEDLQILEKEHVDLVWIPDRHDIFDNNFQSFVEVTKISKPLEGASRPGHFKGVTTIVSILFNVFQPNSAYFGQKDAQQLQVIKQMVKDLRFNLKIIPCPTVREADGLAISSRNQNLSIQGREQATCLFRALTEARRIIYNGERNTSKIKKFMKRVIDDYNLAKIDYISIADTDKLEEIKQLKNNCLISLAVNIERVRLIDNLSIEL